VLVGDCDYSTKNGWVHPVGVHFLGKRKFIVCSELEKVPAPCFICEKIRELQAQNRPVFKYLGPQKYAMNVLEKGSEKPLVYLAPATVGTEIINAFEGMIKETPPVNIFDPLASVAWTVSRSKVNGETHYIVDCDENSAPIITGENVEERIQKILKSATNLDDRFKVSTRAEAETAWALR
jgi:hypothetical protein